jgi:hypothetical protein
MTGERLGNQKLVAELEAPCFSPAGSAARPIGPIFRKCRRWKSDRLLAFVLACVAMSAGPVFAETAGPTEAARTAARTKLVEGVDALRRGEHQVALEKFQEAYALVPSPKIHYDFGLAHMGLGHSAEALTAFERFLAEARDAPADKRQKAAFHATALRSQVGTATITVNGAVDGTTVSVDARDVGAPPLGGPRYLDPGRHEIAVRLWGVATGAVQQIEIRAGQNTEVALRVDATASTGAGALAPNTEPPVSARPPLPGSVADPVPPAGSALATTTSGDSSGRARRIAALSIGAASVAVLGAGLTFGVLARRESDSLSRDSTNGAPPRPPTPFDPEKESRGTTYATLQVIGLIGGAVGVATGIVLYATSRGRITVEPMPARAVAGANLQVRF